MDRGFFCVNSTNGGTAKGELRTYLPHVIARSLLLERRYLRIGAQENWREGQALMF